MMRPREIYLYLLLLVGLLTAAGCTVDLSYDKHAIVYAVSDYPAGSNDLDYTDDDAREFADLLSAQGYQVILRVTDDSNPDPLDEASKDQLARDFEAIEGIADLDDLFLFYFSGHGDQDSASSGTTESAPGSDNLDEVLVMVDDSLSSIVYLSDDELADLLRSIPCARRIVLIDACYSGGFIGNQLEIDAIPPSLWEDSSSSFLGGIGDAIRAYANYGDMASDIAPTDALVIASSGERELSYESPYSGDPELFPYYHGVMTYFLLQAADRGDYNRDSYVTMSETYHYIAQRINSEWNRQHSLYSNFFPHISGGPVDYILFVK